MGATDAGMPYQAYNANTVAPVTTVINNITVVHGGGKSHGGHGRHGGHGGGRRHGRGHDQRPYDSEIHRAVCTLGADTSYLRLSDAEMYRQCLAESGYWFGQAGVRLNDAGRSAARVVSGICTGAKAIWKAIW